MFGGGVTSSSLIETTEFLIGVSPSHSYNAGVGFVKFVKFVVNLVVRLCVLSGGLSKGDRGRV
jgi:hypothetical protein